MHIPPWLWFSTGHILKTLLDMSIAPAPAQAARHPSQTVDGRNHNDGDTIERRACPGARHRNPASSCRREFVRQPDSLEKVHAWNQLPFSENCPNPHARLWMFMRCSPTLIGAIAATRSRTATATTCKEGRNGKACNCSVVGAATWSSDATTAARPSTSTRRETFPPRWRVAPALVELLLNSANRSQTVTASSRLEYR